MPNGVKASVFLAMRSDLLTALQDIDAEIDRALSYRSSKRAAQKARELFAERARVAEELEQFGIAVEPHPAVAR